jgi:hypothetical protein
MKVKTGSGHQRPGRQPIITSCEHTGRSLVHVQIPRYQPPKATPQAPLEAVLYLDDFDMMLALGLSPHWQRSPSGYVVAAAHLASGSHVGVARVMLDAGPGEIVRFLDRNPLNLRSENLKLVPGWATRRDRDWLTPPKGGATCGS